MKKLIISAFSAILVVLTLASCAKEIDCPCCEQKKPTNDKCVFDGTQVCEDCYKGLMSGEIR